MGLLDFGSGIPRSSVREHLVHPKSDQCDACVRKSRRTNCKFDKQYNNVCLQVLS